MKKDHFEIIPEQHAKTILAGAGVAVLAVSGICSVIVRRCHKEGMKKEKQKLASCPICGGRIIGDNRHSRKCISCEVVFQKCEACKKLYHGFARYCPYCGIESKNENTITLDGISYKIGIQEPLQQGFASHIYCSCGTPFMENGKYCQLCGNKRP